MRKFLMYSLLVFFCLALSACAMTPMSASSKFDAQRSEILEMSRQTLDTLYRQYPEARESIGKAAGYAVFSNFGMKFVFMGGADGHGVAIDNATKKPVYMKMVELQPGLGLGAQKFKIVLIFASHEDLNKFIYSGWEFGANAMAAFKSDTQEGGGQLGVNMAPGITMYQLSEKGAVVGVSVTAGKYFRNDELN